MGLLHCSEGVVDLCRMKAGWKKSAYTAAVVLHVLAWLVALAGLAATQSRCKDDEAYPATDSLFAPEVGSDCSKLFRCADERTGTAG